jgi:hypothetical protein
MQIRSILAASAVCLATLQLAACADGAFRSRSTDTAAPAENAVAEPIVLSGTCNAAAAADAVGKPASAALQSELITKTLAKTLRVVRPGDSVTQDFSSQRLNLEVDGGGRIVGARCG